MLRRHSLIVGALALVAVLTHPGESQTPSGDALPSGAIARLGTLRYRHGAAITFVAFPDAKSVLTAGQDNTVRLWDRETGKEIRRYDVAAANAAAFGGRMVYYGGQPRLALSPDGKVLANILVNNTIQLLSVETGKEIRQLPMPRIAIAAVYFAPDGKSIVARGADRTTYLLDAETGKEIRQIKGTQAGAIRFGGQGIMEATGVSIAPDGRTIATAELEFNMQKVTTHIRLTEAETGKELHKIDTTQGGVSALAYSPDRKQFAYASGNVIHLRQADGVKEIRTFNTQGGVAALVFSPDGKTLAVRARDLVVRLYDTESGKTTHTLGEAAGAVANANLGFTVYGGSAEPRDLAFSADGKTLALGGQQALRFFDVATGKEQAAAGGHRSGITAVVIAPDGKKIVTRGADNTIRTWNATTGQEVGQFTEPKGTNHAAFSPDAKFAALSNIDGTIRLVDIAQGKELHSLRGHQNGAVALAFTPDGKMLASRGSFDNTIRLFDVEKGTDLRQITIATGNPNALVGGFSRVGATGGQGLAFSADGQTIAAYVGGRYAMIPGGGQPVAVNNSLRLWDVATAKELRQFNLPPERSVVISIAFSPDGRVLAAENTDQTVSLWEIASGRERGVLGQPLVAGQPGMPMPVFVGGGGFGGRGPINPAVSPTLAYSPDGSLVATRGPNNTVGIWQVDAGKQIESFKGHEGTILALAFAANGTTLASGSADTTTLVWDIAKVKREPKMPAAQVQAKGLDGLWNDLLGDDAVRAYRGLRSLAAVPEQATVFLREKVKPAAPPDVEKIDQWISDLDSAIFAKRARAAEELEKLGELAVPALRKVLTSTASLELRRRVEPILEKATTGALSAEQLRMVRAIEALEQMGTPDARQTLEALARGAQGALQTRQAKATLNRLVK